MKIDAENTNRHLGSEQSHYCILVVNTTDKNCDAEKGEMINSISLNFSCSNGLLSFMNVGVVLHAVMHSVHTWAIGELRSPTKYYRFHILRPKL